LRGFHVHPAARAQALLVELVVLRLRTLGVVASELGGGIGLTHLHPLFFGGAAREGGRDQEEGARETRHPHCAALYRVYALNGNGPCEIVRATASGPLSSSRGNGWPPSCPCCPCSSSSWRPAPGPSSSPRR